eukprot:7274344-Prymnesium_polylepis.1
MATTRRSARARRQERNALAATACRTNELINIENAHVDERHDQTWDIKRLNKPCAAAARARAVSVCASGPRGGRFNFKTREVMCLPITNEDGALVGCIQ